MGVNAAKFLFRFIEFAFARKDIAAQFRDGGVVVAFRDFVDDSQRFLAFLSKQGFGDLSQQGDRVKTVARKDAVYAAGFGSFNEERQRILTYCRQPIVVLERVCVDHMIADA